MNIFTGFFVLNKNNLPLHKKPFTFLDHSLKLLSSNSTMKTFIQILCSLLFPTLLLSQEKGKFHDIQLTEDVRIKYRSLVSDSTLPDGKFKLYWKNRIQVEGSFNKGIKDGKWTRYFSDGTPAIKAYYKNNKKDSIWTYYRTNGKILSKIQFKNGKKKGNWKGYYPDGKIASEIAYSKYSIPEKYIHYYPSGEVIYYGEEARSGENFYKNESYYYKNNQIALFKQLKNDTLHGKYTLYHISGAKWEDFRFEKGKLTTVLSMATKYGTPRFFGTIKKGNGTLNRYTINGELFSVSNFKNGILNDSIHFYQNGKIIGEGVLNNGYPINKWKIYSQYYRLIQEREYFNSGDSIQIKYLLSKHDNEKVTGHLVNGKREGTWKTYNVYNEVIKEENYQQGFLHGPYYKYEGKIIRTKGNFEWGQKSGQWNYYNTWRKEIYKETYNDSISLNFHLLDQLHSKYTNLNNLKRWEQTRVGYEQGHPTKVVSYYFDNVPGMALNTIDQLTYPGINQYLGFNKKLHLNYTPHFAPPSFPGGSENEKIYVLKNQLVSDEALQNKVSGFNLILFNVDEFGFSSDFQVVKSLGYGLDELSINLLRIMPFWEPAMLNGIPVDTYILKQVTYPDQN